MNRLEGEALSGIAMCNVQLCMYSHFGVCEVRLCVVRLTVRESVTMACTLAIPPKVSMVSLTATSVRICYPSEVKINNHTPWYSYRCCLSSASSSNPSPYPRRLCPVSRVHAPGRSQGCHSLPAASPGRLTQCRY